MQNLTVEDWLVVAMITLVLGFFAGLMTGVSMGKRLLSEQLKELSRNVE